MEGGREGRREGGSEGGGGREEGREGGREGRDVSKLNHIFAGHVHTKCHICPACLRVLWRETCGA